MSRVGNYLIHCCYVCFLALGVAPLAYLVTDRDPPLERIVGIIQPPDPVAGSEVRVYWKSIKHRDCDGVVHRYVVDAKEDRWPIPTSPVRYPEYVNDNHSFQQVTSFKLPLLVACGPARYTAEARYVCNFTHRWFPIVVDQPAISFNIGCGEPVK